MESLLAYPLREWSFDPLTAFITVVVAPVFLLLLALLRTALKRWGRYAFEGVLYWLNRAVIHEMAATLTLKRYARLLLAGQSRFLLVPGKIDVPLAIEQVYVPLLLESADRAATFDHANLFECGNRIRILGDPGSGKSSIVKNLLRDECHRAVRRPRQARLAILLELRTLKAPFDLDEDALGDWLLRVLRDSVAANEIYKMAECLDNYARTSGLLVLLDGLDEVSSSAYPDAERAIIQLSQRLAQLSSENLIVLTMRTQFHHQVGVAYRMSFPGTLSLKRFSSSDIYDFLVRWPFPATREMHVARIYKDLNDRPTLREMCSNPLLLAMYVAEDQIAGHPIIPESRTEFYKRVTDELLTRRRMQQIGLVPGASKLREQRLAILGRTAFAHMLDPTEPANSLDWGAAVRVATDVIGCSSAEAEMRMHEIAKETGIISYERMGETFRFIHLTFCECLAASEASDGRSDGWVLLMGAHGRFQDSRDPTARSRLVEVLPFAAGLLPRYRRAQAIEDLKDAGGGHLLTSAFLETKLYEHPAWIPHVQSQQKALLETAPHDRDDAWLRALHLFTVVVNDAARSGEHVRQEQAPVRLDGFFAELASSRGAKIRQLISTYATQDAVAGFRVAALCQLDMPTDLPQVVVEHCDQPAFLALVIDHAVAEPERAGKWAQLLAEAALSSRVVALKMSEMPSLEAWERPIERLPPQYRWDRHGFIERSFFTDVYSLTHATISEDTQAERCSWQKLAPGLRGFNAPGSVSPFTVAGRWGTHAGTILYFGIPFATMLMYPAHMLSAVVCDMGSLYEALGVISAEWWTDHCSVVERNRQNVPLRGSVALALTMSVTLMPAAFIVGWRTRLLRETYEYLLYRYVTTAQAFFSLRKHPSDRRPRIEGAITKLVLGPEFAAKAKSLLEGTASEKG